MPAPTQLHLAVALDGAGWHPAAWREPQARPAELFTAGYWIDQIQQAERGLLDFVTIEDGPGMQAAGSRQPAERTDRVRGRLDAVLIAARAAPLTRHVGLIPTAVVTYSEPFHISKAIATLDYVSTGRAGLRVQVSGRQQDAALFGRRTFPELRPPNRADPAAAQLIGQLFDDAADYVEVVRRLWDSWEDDAEIRDVATGRFVDRGKLHYIDFAGEYFSVRGPSITPRPPQGQPVVSALAHDTVPYRLIARSADIGYVTRATDRTPGAIVTEIRSEQRAAGRAEETIHIFGDLVVFLDGVAGAAAGRKARLDELAYERAQAFLQTACGLFDSWRGDEIIADQQAGIFVADREAGWFAHRDAHFDIGGWFNVPRSPQGRPVIFQAGDSPEGREFAAASADAIFSRHATLDAGQAFYADLKGRLARHGRTRDQLLILPAATFVIGDTDAEAAELAYEVRRQQVSGQTAIKLLEQLWNTDLSGYDPDGPLPGIDPDPGGNTIARGMASVRMHRDPLATAAQWRAKAQAHGWSIRELIVEVTGSSHSSAPRPPSRSRSTTSSRPTPATGSSSCRISRQVVSTSSRTR